MLTRRSMLFAPALACAAASFDFNALADDFPSGPITIIVSFPAGGSIDVVMRAMAVKLQERLGKPVVIENRAGAGGVLATADVVKASPDGRTLLASASSLAANPTLFKSLPFDTLKDLQSVSLVFRTPLVLVVNPKVLPIHSISELVALLKESPGKINFAHGGPGSAIHLAAELFQTMTKTKMTGVSYRGAPLGLNDVMAGHVALMFADAGSVMGQIAAGTVRPLGVSSTTRIPALPDVPTISEAGVPGFDAVGWTLVSAPAATPKPIVDKLSAELAAAAATPEVKSLIIKLGTIPLNSPSPAELQKFVASEIDRWGDLIERAGAANTL
jgi:tripartite-type tricarboxylate transporter receptor subunit TctC